MTSRLPSFLVRADASPQIGTGHVMRCLALAQAAQDMRFAVHMMGRVNVPWVLEKLHSENIPFTRLEGAIPSEESSEYLIKLIQKSGFSPDWVVMDGYHFTLSCQKAVRAAGYKLLLIDDYNHLPEYSCDILLNQNLGAEEFVYSGDIGTKLLGPKYALLRREFVKARKLAEQRHFSSKPKKLLLTLGGGDFSSHLRLIASALALPELTGCTLRVIQGGMREEDIRHSLAKCPATIEILGRVDDMPALLLDTDLCITAGGSTCWELCALGVPFLALSIAKNQDTVVQGLLAQGIAPPFQQQVFQKMLSERGYFNGFRQQLLEQVDGKGAEKVLFAAEPSCLIFCRASAEDSRAIFEIANDPSVRAVSFSKTEIEWTAHTQWYEKRIHRSASEPFYVLKNALDQTLIGYVRFDIQDGLVCISIAISKQWRGGGIGKYLLECGCSRFVADQKNRHVYAWCLKKNIASLKMFLRNGFTLSSDSDEKQEFVLLRKDLYSNEQELCGKKMSVL